MPIRKFIDGEVFDPDTIREMDAALLGACRTMRLKVKDDAARRLLAKSIIELAKHGEHNPERLRAAALKDFRLSGRGKSKAGAGALSAMPQRSVGSRDAAYQLGRSARA